MATRITIHYDLWAAEEIEPSATKWRMSIVAPEALSDISDNGYLMMVLPLLCEAAAYWRRRHGSKDVQRPDAVVLSKISLDVADDNAIGEEPIEIR